MLHTLLVQWQPFVAVALLSLFWIWESWAPFSAAPTSRWGHAARNLTLAGLNALVLVVAFSGLTVAIAALAESQRLGILYQISLPATAHAGVALIVLDFWTYWWHRLNHKIPFLWRFHRMHHSDPLVDVTTAVRFHLGEIAMSQVIRLGLIPLIGIPVWVLILYDMVLLASTQFHHANIELPPQMDSALRYVLVSPYMHKVHHSRAAEETDSNFSSLLSLWDRLFGSYREKENYREIQFGLTGYEGGTCQSLGGMLSTPFLRRKPSELRRGRSPEPPGA